MKQDIRLYLAGQRADLGKDTRILYNYKITDTQNPTAVKNSFSKSIVLEGTDNNNAIFGEIYDLARLQQYGAGEYSGKDFNPLKRAEFVLYIDNEIFETGYFKLTLVEKTGNKINYSITLYGGLGEFLYNLQEAEGGNKLEFKDLKLIRDTEGEEPIPDLGFTIGKDTVNTAWNEIQSYSSKYSTLNFVPCYNGVPEDFGANTTLINLYGHSYNLNNVTGISSYHYWAKGEASRNLTEWETRDLRCHLQRPALRVKHLLNSVCVPENNGGYRVELDNHFFNSDNPYYEDTFITLNLIKDINGEGEENVTTITGATLGEEDFRNDTYDIETDVDFSEFTNLNMEIEVNMTPRDTVTGSSYYMSTWKDITPDFTLLSRFIRDYEYYSAVILQLVAYDEKGKEVAQSAAYILTSQVPGKDTPDFTPLMNKNATVYEWKTVYGRFDRVSASQYTFVDNNGNPTRIRFSFPSSTAFRTLKLRVQRPYFENYKYTFMGGTVQGSYGDGAGYLWLNPFEKFKDNYDLSEIHALRSAIMLDDIQISDFTANATRYGGFLSGKFVPQDRLLTLGITPGEFLLSFTKLFGLHIWKDPVEKVIYIADRDTFYHRNEIVSLQDYIDRGKAIKITPQVAKAKWYDFNVEQHESQANNQYTETYGTDFGLARVNTSFDFDSENISVYEGQFKGAVQVLESSPYYYNDFNLWPVYCYNGFTLTTYAMSGTVLEGTEHTVNTLNTPGEVKAYPINAEYNGFDIFDKPQFHTEGNSAGEGDLSLVFFVGMVPCSADTAGFVRYWLTDDLEEMVGLNDKTPCWILTDSERDYNGNIIAIQRYELPKFSRYITYGDNGKITHTLDFGKTLETYVPGTVLTSGCSIYEKVWKDYIGDMYDVNSRILNCSVLIRGQVNPNWLRRFYYFDQNYWRLNQVKEWDPGVYNTTLCEFLKVNDLNNYSLTAPGRNPLTDFRLADYIPTNVEPRAKYYTVPATVTAVTAEIFVQDGGLWYYGDGPGADYRVEYEGGPTYYYPYSSITASGEDRGSGDTTEVFNIGANVAGTPRIFRFNIVIYGAGGDEFHYIYLRQEPVDVGTITMSRFGGSGNVSANGGQVLIRVESTQAWTANLTYDYTSLDRYYGQSGVTNIVMTVEPNDTESSRFCRIVATNVGGSSYTLTVEQDGLHDITTLDFHMSDTVFEADGRAIGGYVQCPAIDNSWEVVQCASWITITPSSGGTGTTQITATAQANAGETRYGEVTIRAGVESDTITFGQRNPAVVYPGVEITLDKYNFDAQGETINGTVESTEPWRMETSANWLVPSIYSGDSGTTNFTLTVNANEGRYGRVGTITAVGGNYMDEDSIAQDGTGN